TNTVLVNAITHNVVVQSSGTDVNANTAYIWNLAQSATSFALAYGEFAFIGSGQSYPDGIVFQASSAGSVSSSTIRNGYIGIDLASNYVSIQNNNVYANTHSGISIGRSSNSITANNLYANVNPLNIQSNNNTF